jgi:hypothetical protein
MTLRGIVDAPWYIRNDNLHKDLDLRIILSILEDENEKKYTLKLFSPFLESQKPNRDDVISCSTLFRKPLTFQMIMYDEGRSKAKYNARVFACETSHSYRVTEEEKHSSGPISLTTLPSVDRLNYRRYQYLPTEFMKLGSVALP